MEAAETDTVPFEALLAYGIMDTPNEPVFDRLTAVAAGMFGAPVALLTFIDRDRMWVKSSYGTDPVELPRPATFCTHTIAQGELVVLDTHKDTKFATHPLVTGALSPFKGLQALRFYAGVSLVAADGAHIGTICVLDDAPRTELPTHTLEALRALGGLAIDLLDGRRQNLAEQEATRRALVIDHMLARIALASGCRSALEGLMRCLGQAYHSISGQLWLRSTGETSLRTVSAYRDGTMDGLEESLPDAGVIDLADSFMGSAIAQDRPIEVAISQAGPFADDKMIAACRAQELSHLVVVPFVAGDEAYVIALGFEGHDFDVAKRMHELVMIRDGLKPAVLNKATEERLRLLSSGLDMVPSGVVITQLDGPSNDHPPHIIYVNDGFCRMSGYAATELIGQKIDIIHGTETSAADVQSLRTAAYAGRPARTSLLEYRKDGTTYNAQVDLVPIGRGHEGRGYRVSLHMDITNKLLAEREQRQQSESFRVLFVANPLPMWVYDGQTMQFLMVNQAAIAFYGWSLEQFMAMTIRDIRPAEEWQTVESIPHTGASSMSEHRTWVHNRADGSVVKMYGVSQPHPMGGPHARLSVFWDVTGVEAAREELKRKNASLLELTQQLREKTNEAVEANRLARLSTWCLTSDLAEMSWSDDMYTLIDRTRDEFPPSYKNTLHVLHTEDRSLFEQAVRLANADGGNHQLEARVIRPDGRTRHIRIALHRASAEKVSAGLIGYFQDVSEQWETQQALMRAERLAILGNLTGGIAHDFNNLSTVVTLNLEEAIAELPETDDLQIVLGAALQAAQRGAELTSQLLAYARQAPLRPHEVSLGAFFQTISPLVKRALGPNYTVQLTIDDKDCMPLVDSSQLQSAVLNIALNARDAMPGGGEVLIRATSVRLPSVTFPIDQVTSGDYALISISDLGCGIEPEILPHVFEPFYTTKQSASGLGLSMADGFVGQSGGYITVESTVGQGTTIRLFLPMAAPAVTKPLDPAGLTRKRALLVEDKPAVLATVSRMFVQLGYDVCGVPNAAAALAELDRGQDFALMFTDIVLPGEMDGIALSKAVQRRAPHIPILLTSGFSDYNLSQSDVPGIGILMKPYKRQDLLDRLNGLTAPSSC
jgi:PAS domain S-box-containing protein